MRRPRNELVRNVIEMLLEAGAKPRIWDGGKHPQVYWVDQRGRPCVVTLPRSPSDYRAWANKRAQLRRMLRNGAGGPPA